MNSHKTLWGKYYVQYVGMKSSVYFDDDSKPDDSYVPFFRNENGKIIDDFSEYKNNVFIPDIDRLLNSDIKFITTRLLFINDNILGYVMEGSNTITHRNLRRVEEYGMFLSTSINSVIENRNMVKLHKELENSSKTDYLTGILNRRGFYDSLDNILNTPENYGKTVTILSIDMDGLKTINDNYGHEEGDFAIKHTAIAIKDFVEKNGTGICARYGGDEFEAAIITDKEIYLNSNQISKTIYEIVYADPSVKSKEYAIKASVGKTSVTVSRGINIETYLKSADKEMYKNKNIRKQNS